MAAFILMSVGAFSCNEIQFSSISDTDGGGRLTLQFGSWVYYIIICMYHISYNITSKPQSYNQYQIYSVGGIKDGH